MTTAAATPLQVKGGAFLIEDRSPNEIFTAEDLNEEHLAIARTVDQFWTNEVEPHLEAIRQQTPGVALSVLRKAAELGLAAIPIPEKFGGMEMDLPSVMIAGEHLARDASYGSWHSSHTGIGTLPVLFFGNEEQKRRYLPKLAKVELLAAYALTEPLAGSDALAVRTRADLSADGKYYVLNGQKMWITNGGAADLFTVFAKVGGEKFTAFLVERSFPGVTSGAEEHKMGIKGSSTTAVYFDNVRVPVENVLGEVGRGHIIAFNILNIGRLKLGPGAVGGAKSVLAICLKYAKERKAFGSAIAEFGAIQYKLAEMAIRTFAVESMVWRVVGLIESQLAQSAHDKHADSQTELKAVEEYAAECSMIKVYASEMLDYVVDEGVQIHGGYGYHQDYAVERAYRDSRINRIFEGTNEINRLLITGMLLKRAARGQLGLIPAVQAVVGGPGNGATASASTDKDEDAWLVQSGEEDCAVHDRDCLSKIRGRVGKTAGDRDEHFRHRHGSFRDGVELASKSQACSLGQRDQCRQHVRRVFARGHGSSRSLGAKCHRRLLGWPRPPGEYGDSTRLCQLRSARWGCTAAQYCRPTSGRCALHGLTVTRPPLWLLLPR